MNWFELPFFESDYDKVREKINKERKTYAIYPKDSEVFNAFYLTPFDNVKVVILGQDPYHTKGAAHGLAFSVPNESEKTQPSLRNIFKELRDDVGIDHTANTNLKEWASQGVLLYNTTLTVRKGEANSHKDIGWKKLTEQVIKTLSDKKDNIVFILWGNHGRGFKKFIDTAKHLVLESSHPSPFSARYGFFGSKCFSKTNAYLEKVGKTPIKWDR